ncbi:MAG: hypothetical protein HY879_05525, partial [Deltaproteobacteria bacterium]|nr:hypothetical protein [Deltaproteobacteria bacterium]
MKWLEIIKLRSVRENPEELDEFLRSLDQVSQEGPIEIKIYRHAAIETDLSLHLLWEANQPEKNGSALGLRLAQVLKDFGLIDHSLWLEQEK